MTKACTSVFTDSTSSERRTRLSWRSQKKHFAHTLEMCLSRLRSNDILTPRTWTWSLAATVFVPSCSYGPPLPNGVCPYLDPTQTSSVFSLFSLSLLAGIRRLTSVSICGSERHFVTITLEIQLCIVSVRV